MAEISTPSPNAIGTTTSHSGSNVSMTSAFVRWNNHRFAGVECSAPDFETRDDSEDKSTIVDHGRIPVIRQPPPLTVETGWPSCCEHPNIVYIISNPPMMDRRPSSIQFTDRVSSIDTLTMSGDEASQDPDKDEDSNDEDFPVSPLIHNVVAPPLAPRNNISTGPTRPLPLSFRGNTYGSAISCL
jgi:hypothetical protein